ncbi:MAG: hypothetical protein PHT94_03875 [Candidatus Nanoarchaeia archaeon]|nr:hypothetical protein [Candidatus Nanoarchaeia archaeon]
MENDSDILEKRIRIAIPIFLALGIFVFLFDKILGGVIIVSVVFSGIYGIIFYKKIKANESDNSKGVFFRNILEKKK